MFLSATKPLSTGYVAKLEKQISNNKSILTKTNELIKLIGEETLNYTI